MPPEAAAPVVPGIAFRDAEPRDEDFLRALYRSTRDPELDLTDWDEARKQAFADDQYALQDQHYRKHYRGASFLVIERAGEPIGRLYLCPMGRELRVMDIVLVAAARHAGIGTAIIKGIQQDATRHGTAVTLHVEGFNSARAFYLRLGFREDATEGIYIRMRWDPSATGG